MDQITLLGLSQQMALRRTMDMIANNLANMSTTAYKAEQMIFEEYLVEVEGGGPESSMNFVIDKGLARDHSVGRFEVTGGSLDIAVDGPGFFVVDTPEGPRYTRNGHFELDTEGRLVTTEGHPVLDADSRAISLDLEDGPLSIAGDGTISVGGGGAQFKLQLVEFSRPAELEKQGNSLFAAAEDPIPAERSSLVQGALESSNVQPILEMSRMIEVSRTYESTARLLERASSLSVKTIERLGRAA
ncbi:MAG: flagellar basal-body rod protein FlgF [Alphaproteobacteria bacterium]|nr:flagellar basal-body rod protein FlgF [Alphaproteobacteria bacterium]